jgi:hypothetical protein
VWCAQALSDLGDWAAVVAVAALVLDRTGSAALTGSVFAVSLGPAMVAGPYLATLGDRLPRRTVMVTADLVRTALALAMALPVPVAALYVLLAATAVATAPFRAARAALIPEMVPIERYHDALTLRAITEQLGVLGGYATGGALVAVIGARGALVVNAATFLASAALLLTVTAGRAASAAAPDGSRPTAHGQLRAALAGLAAQRVVLVTAGLACAFAGAGMVGESLTVVFAVRSLGREAALGGILAAAVPVGTIVAGLVPFDPGGPAPVRRIGLTGAVAAAVAASAFAVGGSLPMSLLAFAGVGGLFGTVIAAQAVCGAHVPAHLRSSTFGFVQAVMAGTEATAAVGGGLLADAVGVRTTCLAISVAALGLGVGVALAKGPGPTVSETSGPTSLDVSSASRISSP